ncbi:tyrosine-protein phosphatase [Cryobacterium sp. CG_9.6]|uniref:tyrosine-protein phosphatase n=1 Tax=Cryobacterium sp. CG_9.6 TaxID=2760710 RepID=UPI002475A02B|nr:tyrosine-protein phosphatase [Cryobacterium sp. CG_9.6]MDH6237111.1 protein tyrosine/serine phosphatase [Cryobacterium sp. CG_9.6]
MTVDSGFRNLNVDGLVNARDLGGLRRQNGSLTPRGVFFRAENVDWATSLGWKQMFDAGIRTVVDLRQPAERDRDTGRRPSWLETIHVDLDGLENVEFWKDYWDNGLVGTALYFLPHLTSMPERTGAALSAAVNAPRGGVLFHCMAGRDRTGMIALLLLLAVGTDPDEIVDDYLETVRLGDQRAVITKRNNEESVLEEFCQRHGTTTEGAFRSVIEALDLPATLTAANLSEHDRGALRTWRGSIASTSAR